MGTKRSWTRMSRRKNGDCFFSGDCHISRNVLDELSQTEISWIIEDISKNVKRFKGLASTQIYTSSDNKKVYVIDNAMKSTIESWVYTPQQRKDMNYFRILFEEEY